MSSVGETILFEGPDLDRRVFLQLHSDSLDMPFFQNHLHHLFLKLMAQMVSVVSPYHWARFYSSICTYIKIIFCVSNCRKA